MAQKLQAGGYDINTDWRFQQGLKDTNGSQYSLYYNSKDPTQNFSAGVDDTSVWDSLRKIAASQGPDTYEQLKSANASASFGGDPNLINSPEKVRQAQLKSQADVLSASGVSGSSGQAQNADKIVNQPMTEPNMTVTGTADQPQTATSTQPQVGTQAGTQTQGSQTGVTTPFAGQNLIQGSNGPQVSLVQQALGGLNVDGKFGPKTQAAVVAYQTAHGLKADGIVGPKTWASLMGTNSNPNANDTTGAGNMPAGTTTAGTTGTTAPTGTTNGQTPAQNVMDTWNTVYKDLGLGDIKSQYKDILKQQSDLQGKKNEEAANIKNDPWLAQGVMDGKLKALDDKYATKLDTLAHLGTLYDSLYQEGTQQAQFLVGHIEQDTQSAIAAAQKKQDAIDALTKNNSTQTIEANGRKYLITTNNNGKILNQVDVGSAVSASAPPSSYQEWTLAGKPGTYADFLASKGGTQLPPLASGQPSTYQIEGNKRILDQVDLLLPDVSNSTVGLGSLLSNVPGSSSADFAAKLDTLKANIAFGALTQMREASKSGGALGQISDTEEKLLSSTLGALSTKQSPTEFTKSLNQIKTSIQKWNEAAGNTGSSTIIMTGPGGTFNVPADKVDIFKQNGYK